MDRHLRYRIMYPLTYFTGSCIHSPTLPDHTSNYIRYCDIECITIIDVYNDYTSRAWTRCHIDIVLKLMCYRINTKSEIESTDLQVS